MMNRKLKQTGIYTIILVGLLSGCNKDSSAPIFKFIEQNAVTATGVNFFSKKLTVLNPDTGKEVLPCDNKEISKIDSNKTNGKCITKFVDSDINSDLASVLKLSQGPIEGQIEKDGKMVTAHYIVTVKALYEGSNCETVFSGGQQIELCSRRRR